MIETAATLYVYTHYYLPALLIIIVLIYAVYINYSTKRWFMKRHIKETWCKGSWRVGHRKTFEGIEFGEHKYKHEHYCYRCKKWF